MRIRTEKNNVDSWSRRSRTKGLSSRRARTKAAGWKGKLSTTIKIQVDSPALSECQHSRLHPEY